MTRDEELAKAKEYVNWLIEHEFIMTDELKERVNTQVMLTDKLHRAQDAGKDVEYSDHVDIYVDGSYNPDTNEYGYGILMIDGKKERMFSGHGKCEHGGRNVEGEVAGARKAIKMARTFYKSATIYHDYEGIGKWADKQWKTNKPYTEHYAKMVEHSRNEYDFEIVFEHVDGHSGVEGNEKVDVLAKQACGMSVPDSKRLVPEVVYDDEKEPDHLMGPSL